MSLLFAGLGVAGVFVGHRFATTAIVDLGPTDLAYVRNLRDIERDGGTYFRWTGVPSSAVILPVRFCGPGSVRLRMRRHFPDPAVLSVSVAGNILGQETIQAQTDLPYRISEYQVLKAICTDNASILLESSVTNDRPLGVAVDWIEIRSPGGFFAAPETLLRGAAALGIAALAISLGGGGLIMLCVTGGAMTALIGVGFALAPVAAERVLRGGLAGLVLTLIVGAIIARLAGGFALSRRLRLTLVVITLMTLVSRVAFLHPQAFYPDYRVHALVLQTLESRGLPGFLDQLFEIQYARSLGLQQIDGNWYPFPYPPGAYVVAQGVSRLFALGPLDALLVTASVAASLIPGLTVAFGMVLGAGELASVGGALFVALHPLLVRRMALGYFPGVAGQFLDALALLIALRILQTREPGRRRPVVLVLALLAAFLVYTQSMANFGLLAVGLLVVEGVRRRPAGVRTALRFAVAAALAFAASAGAFYWRYLPVMENVALHRAQPEARILDRLEELRRTGTEADPQGDDSLDEPFSGPTLNPLRGLARLGSRLWRFNGPYALAILIGCGLLWRKSERSAQNLMLAWAGVPVAISLLASGLPSPNGFQHLKDLEFVSPLLSLALGLLSKQLWEWRPALSAVFVAGWLLFATRAFTTEVGERLTTLAGR